MASFGKVLDLLDDRYLNLQDVTGNVEPMPTLVPYEQYGQNVLVYRMDTEHDVFMGILQDFTMRRAHEIGQELWTWCAQWEVDSLATSAPSPKKARLNAEQPESLDSVHPPPRKGPAYTVFERRVLDSELMQEEDMLRILIDIVQVDSSIVPNFIEFMYRWIDFYEGDGKALNAALRHEIPSLWDFEYHPLILPADLKRRRKAFEKAKKARAGNATGQIQNDDKTPSNPKAEELAQGSPTKKMREIPDLAAMERQLEQSERLKYREVKYGIQPPKLMVPFPPLVNIPRDGYKRQKYYAACFKSRQRALTLLLEAGVTIPQIQNYKKLQKAHPKDTPHDEDGNGLRYYEKDADYAQFEYKRKQEDIALKEKTLEVSINDKLVAEALLAARGGRSEGLSVIPLIPPTPIPSYLRRHDDRVDALIESIAAHRKKARAKIGLVPTPLVQKMKSKVFEGAFDRETLNAMKERTAFEHYNERNESEADVDMDDYDTDDYSEDDDDDDDDMNGPPGISESVGMSTLPLHPPLPSLSQGLRLPALAPPPPLLDVGHAQGLPLLNTSGRNIAATAPSAPSSQAGPPKQPSVHAPTIIPGPPLPHLPSSAIIPPIAAGQSLNMTLSSIPPLLPPPIGFMPQGQTSQASGQLPQQSQLGNINSLSSLSNPSVRPPNPFVLGPPRPNPFQQVQGPPQLQLPSTIPRLPALAPPPGFTGGGLATQWNQTGSMQMQGLQNTGLGPSQSTGLPASSGARMLGNYLASQRALADAQATGQLTTQTTSTLQARFPGMSTFTFPAPSQPAPPPNGESASFHGQTSTAFPNLSNSHPNTSFLTPPRTGIARNAPNPLILNPVPPLSPLSGLAPHLLATSPFFSHARPIPIQIYFPSIIIPGNLIGPDGIPLGNAGIRETDAMLAGHCVPGSGNIVLSKAVFLPVGVWTNMLRRVHRGAYTVLETYAVPAAHPAARKLPGTAATTSSVAPLMNQNPTPHKTVYDKLVQAYSIMARSPDREQELTKRWRTTPGPMTQRHRGAVWEGWGVTLEQGIEMSVEERKGAMIFSALIDEGVDRKGAGLGGAEGEEAERRRREIEELLEEEEEDLSEDEDGDEDMEG